MPCLVVLFALIGPRVALFVMWVFSSVLSHAYDSWIVPLLGFFLLPWTTLAYALMWDSGHHGVFGFEWFLVALAFLVDIRTYVGGSKEAGRRSSHDVAS